MLVNLQPSEVSGTAVRLRPFSPPIKILVIDSITSFLPSALAFVSAFDLFAPCWFTSLRSTLGRSGRPLPWPYLLLSNFSALLWIRNIAGCCSDTAGNCYYTPSTWKYQGTVFFYGRRGCFKRAGRLWNSGGERWFCIQRAWRKQEMMHL